MEEKKYLDLLAKRDIQPTAIRILVLRTMMQAGRSVSLLDLETMLDTVDKSSKPPSSKIIPVSPKLVALNFPNIFINN